ncbi:MAG TPA: HD domain-containing phosphohydrolase [Petrotogaceae bacterium]|jgi:HD-GYP domain-containing protein (c-di-GMP phosphodiesterase class II)|nr:HD domain-containing phosphohydrolase [Petrotogaceae bacterium]HOG34647.1 HD domain-containing phosphohydrolase [Petrotogaceae bacterium]HPA93293.1 HD domain-containing phosphohydrolase [Petrotogaceae bacterium]HPO26267.1 HD domain-containing phosphohydrolase [Petrotogaceae bacterium]HPX15464.1 HD domain-containing phosphohydrolase [Petrotogaceae bacterium]
MRKVKLSDLKAGFILAEHVTYNAVILLSEGNVLTEADIQKLKNRGIREVIIYDEDDFILGKDIKVEFKDIPPIVEAKKYKEWNDQFEKIKDITKINEQPQEMESLVEDLHKTFIEKDEIILNLFHSIGDKALTLHSINTSIIASIISSHLKMPKVFSLELIKASLIHDLGYGFLNTRIIFDYDKSEDRFVKSHIIAGYKAFEPLKATLSKEIVNSILQHHERYDGKGILMGLRDERISPLVRIMQIGDAYDSYIEIGNNPYEAMSYLLKNAGKLFDPYYVSIFFSVVGLYPSGTKVVLNDGRIAQVIKKGVAAVFPVVNVEGKSIQTGPETGFFIKEVAEGNENKI